MTRFWMLLLTLSCSGALLACSGGDDDSAPSGDPIDAGALPPGEVDFTVLTWNIGNADTSDEEYALRIRSRAFEEHLAGRLRAQQPDVVALQEVLSPFRCMQLDETDPSRTCFGVTEGEPPIRRILGPEYSIACDQNQQSKCIGVHTSFGRIRGVDEGGLALMGAETPALPYAKCDYGECTPEVAECLDQTSVSTVLVDSERFGTVRVINVHPHPFGPPCRPEMVRQAFELVDEHRAILLGDWNFEPEGDDEAAAVWAEHVGSGRRFASHHPIDADQRPITTFEDGRALDRVITDFARGVCEVRAEPRLDAGFDFEAAGIADEEARRPDHLAVVCHLGVSAE